MVKTSLKSPKGQSEDANRRKTYNTMTKRKRTKEQTAIYKTFHRKQKIEQNEPHLEPVVKRWCSGRISSYCSSCDNRRVTRVASPVTSYEYGKDRIIITEKKNEIFP